MDGSSTSLQLSVEQWELLRRLRNSHLTKAQIVRAYDELDRLDRELGNLFPNAPPPSIASADPVSPPTASCQQTSPPSSAATLNSNHKRPHSHIANGLPPARSINGFHPSHLHHPTSNITLRSAKNNLSDGNSLDSGTQSDLEEEARELQELLAYVHRLGSPQLTIQTRLIVT